LIDESGLLMAPLVRRTWAPRGQTPQLLQRCAHREKVSVAAALWLSPDRNRMGLFFQTLVNAYFNNRNVAAFLRVLAGKLAGPVLVLWDGGGLHQGDPIRELLRHHPALHLEKLPPYAPMLNPVEPVWGWLKYGRLDNFAPQDVRQLNQRILTELVPLRRDQARLKNFFHASDLPLPRALLS
jgi:putative transposase